MERKQKWQDKNAVDETDNVPHKETHEPLQDIPEANAEVELAMTSSETMTTETFKKVLELSSEQLVGYGDLRYPKLIVFVVSPAAGISK